MRRRPPLSVVGVSNKRKFAGNHKDGCGHDGADCTPCLLFLKEVCPLVVLRSEKSHFMLFFFEFCRHFALVVGGVAVNLMLAYPPQSPYPHLQYILFLSPKSALCISQSGHRSHNTSKLEPPLLQLSSRPSLVPHLTFTWPFQNGEKEPSCSGYKTAAAALRLQEVVAGERGGKWEKKGSGFYFFVRSEVELVGSPSVDWLVVGLP